VKRVWLLVPLALLVAACGGYSSKSSTTTAAATGAPLKTISVSEKEYSLTPSSFKVTKPGTYAFKATNNGMIAHALEIAGNGVEAKTAAIDPGSSATLTVNLTKTGIYEVYCPIDSHKSMGMKARLTVGGSAGSGATTTTGGTTTNKGSPGY
jgi:uncharacterized cupredoxin-like copper-binding protein